METLIIYDTGGLLPISINAFKNRPCALPFGNDAYQAPTPHEVNRLITLAGWSQSQAARLVGVTYNPKKGSSTIRKWRTPTDKADSREIPYAAWRLMLLYAGVATVDDGRTVGVDNADN